MRRNGVIALLACLAAVLVLSTQTSLLNRSMRSSYSLDNKHASDDSYFSDSNLTFAAFLRMNSQCKILHDQWHIDSDLQVGHLSVAACATTWLANFKLMPGSCREHNEHRSQKVLQCMVDTVSSCARACAANTACAAFDQEDYTDGPQSANMEPRKCCLYGDGHHSGNGQIGDTCFVLLQSKVGHFIDPSMQALSRIGEELMACASSICACNSIEESEYCARSCAALPSNKGMIGRSTVLGRVLWCLAQRQDVHFAMDMFMHTGGGAAHLIAAGMDKALKKDKAWLLGFEVDASDVQEAMENLGEWHPIVVTPHRSLPSKDDLHVWHRDRQNLAVLITHGMPFAYNIPLAGMLPVEFPWSSDPPIHQPADRPGPLEHYCKHLGPVDLLFLNPTFPMVGEWSVLEEFCRPQWVVIANINLPFHAGWIKEALQHANWPVVLEGHHWHEEFSDYGRRAWAVLMRPDAISQ